METIKNRFLNWQGILLFSFGALFSVSARAQTPNYVTNYVTNASYACLKAATLAAAAQTNGGYVAFTVDGTFVMSNTFRLSGGFVFDANGHNVTLSGNTNRVFIVNSDGDLTLVGINLINGRSSFGGAIYNDGGKLRLYNCKLSGNIVANGVGVGGSTTHYYGGNGGAGGEAAGGAVYTRGSRGFLFVTDSIFQGNSAFGGDGGPGGSGAANGILGGNGGTGGPGGNARGGAIFVEGGRAQVEWCLFTNNVCLPGNGGTGGAGGTGLAYGDSGVGGVGGCGYGAGIYNAGSLDLGGCLFVDNLGFGGNSAGIDPSRNNNKKTAFWGGYSAGGGVYNAAQLNVTNSTFFRNSCEGGAGGNTSGGLTARAGNGGIAMGGALASFGGKVSLVNCTIATNWAFGGTNGVAGVSITNNTLYANNGFKGAALGGNIFQTNSTFILSDSILSQGGFGGGNCCGKVIDKGYNISSDASCHFTAAGSLNGINPMLDSKLSRGATFTNNEYFYPPVLALLPGSPAIEAIPTNAAFVPYDQLYTKRAQGFKLDIGAYEVPEKELAPVITKQPKNARVPCGTNVVLSVSALGKNLSYQWNLRGLITTVLTNAVPFTNVTLVTPTTCATASNVIYRIITTNDFTTDAYTVTTITNNSNPLNPEPDITTVTNYQYLTNMTFVVTGTITNSYTNIAYSTNIQFVADTENNKTIPIATNIVPNSFTFITVRSVTNHNVDVSGIVGTSKTIGLTNYVDLIHYGYSTNFSYGTQSMVVTNTDYTQTALGGETNATLKIKNVTAANERFYGVTVTNDFGSTNSASVQVSVFNPIRITRQPKDANILSGASATLSVEFSGGTNCNFQWFCNGSSMTGQTNQTLTTTVAGVYKILVKDADSFANSSNATVKIVAPPSIVSRSAACQNVVAGGKVTLSVTAKGGAPFYYQWRHCGTNIPNMTGASLVISRANFLEDGEYVLSVSNCVGYLTVTNVVKVLPPAPTITSQTVSYFTTNLITLKGAAATNAGISTIQYSLDGGPQTIVSGTTNWCIPDLQLAPGTNIISVFAWNPNGASAAATRTVFYDQLAPLQGTYKAIFCETNDDNVILQSSSGIMSLVLGKSGIFSATIRQRTNTYNVTGQFDSQGVPYVATKPFNICLNVDSSTSNCLVGTVNKGTNWTSPYQGRRVIYSATNKNPAAGKYTLEIFDPETNSVAEGVGAVTLTSAGTVTFDGALADGTRLKALTGTLCAGGVWPFYYALNGDRGAFLGEIVFTANAMPVGSAAWIRPSVGTATYSSGFFTNVFGSPYTNALPLLRLTNETVALSGKSPVLYNTITLSGTKFYISGDTNYLTLSINRTNGLVTGSFRTPGTRNTNSICGALFQYQNLMEGFFVGATNGGGRISLLER